MEYLFIVGVIVQIIITYTMVTVIDIFKKTERIEEQNDRMKDMVTQLWRDRMLNINSKRPERPEIEKPKPH